MEIGGEPVNALHLDHRDITGGIRADHRERCGTAVGEGHRRFRCRTCGSARSARCAGGWGCAAGSARTLRRRSGGSRDDVVVGQNQPVGRQDDAGAFLRLATHIGLQHDHAGHHLGGDLFDAARGMFAAGTLGAAPMIRPPPPPAAWVPSSTTVAAAPPIPADTTAIASAPATNTPARERFSGIHPGGGPIGGNMPHGPRAGTAGIGPAPVPPGIGPTPVPPNGS